MSDPATSSARAGVTSSTDHVTFAQVRETERALETHWPGTRTDEDRRDRVGLCLSGGGIRSAAFSLGVMQALQGREVFKRVDYLSTVSGGGYIGASLMAARMRQEMDPPADKATEGAKAEKTDEPANDKETETVSSAVKGQTRPPKVGAPSDDKTVATPATLKAVAPTFPFARSEADLKDRNSNIVAVSTGDIADSKDVRILRDRSRFLIPNGPRDITLSLALLVRGLVVNMLLLAPFLLALAAATLAWQHFLGPDTAASFSFSIAVAALYAAFGIVWGIRASRMPCEDPRWENRSGWTRLAAVILIPLALIFLWNAHLWLLSQIRGAGHTGPSSTTLIWLGTLFGAATASLGGLAKPLAGILQSTLADPTRMAMVKAVATRAVMVLLALALPAFLYVIVLLLIEAGTAPGGIVAWGTKFGPEYPPYLVVSGVLALGGVARLVTLLSPGKGDRIGLASRIITAAPLVLAILGLMATFATVAPAQVAPVPGTVPVQIGLATESAPPPVATADAGQTRKVELPAAIPVFSGFVVLAMLVSWPIQVNATSLHRLYRDRLEESFSLSWRAPDGSDDKIPPITLDDLAAFYAKPPPPLPKDGETASQQEKPEWRRPYLIANMTVNLSGSAERNKRGRQGDFFVVTAHYVGSDATGYAPASSYAPGVGKSPAERLDLGTVAAVSGAAVASRMGRQGIPLLAPTLAFLNIRLGFWLRNPACAPGAGKKAGSQAGLTLLDEAIGALDEEKPLVYLTDGGHSDNLGLYQLLKRRCDLIISVDAEADPAMTCAALVDVERFARIDLGVRLDCPTSSLREAALGRQAKLARRNPDEPMPTSDPSRHAAMGRIRYPEQKLAGTQEDIHTKKDGILLYIKAAMTGDEPSYVLDYARRHPSFPHETTIDQFFSEEQFEAYRALGYHAARDALRQDGGDAVRKKLLDDLLDRLGTTSTTGDD